MARMAPSPLVLALPSIATRRQEAAASGPRRCEARGSCVLYATCTRYSNSLYTHILQCSVYSLYSIYFIYSLYFIYFIYSIYSNTLYTLTPCTSYTLCTRYTLILCILLPHVLHIPYVLHILLLPILYKL
ncbi:hypothetical protein BJ875DRAFT_16976 [Amylocarpus encephaloides]|uniref:Uncharacterized protein n=1 Tax=Amylocarpus encephaloides TaxID=45428 RepID=A0A9P8C5J7_9HELO|nr:hypothetical protein BJ875DRAFT_16976 [Amylocarpus encephaloides]